MDDLTRPADPSPVVNRVKRAQGQLAGVLRMIEEDRALDDVLNQLKGLFADEGVADDAAGVGASVPG